MGESSARPRRLRHFGETTEAIREALGRRARRLWDEWELYVPRHGDDWRFDFGELPGALEAWADTVDRIGAFAAAVGAAFEQADLGGDSPATMRDTALRRSLGDRWHGVFDRGADICTGLDWGDPDDPPAWLEALRNSKLVVDVAGPLADGTRAGAIRAMRDAHTDVPSRVGAGTDASLGSFASARSIARFSRWFGSVGDAYGGFAAAVEQWNADAGSLNYTDGEVAARAVTRGAAETAGGAVGGVVFAAVAGSLSASCGPLAPACAGVLVAGGSTLGSRLAESIADKRLGRPEPGEHDPDLVRDEVLSGADVRDDVFGEGRLGEDGRDLADATSAREDQILLGQALSPGTAADDAVLPSHLPVVNYDPCNVEWGNTVTGWTEAAPLAIGEVPTGAQSSAIAAYREAAAA